MKSAQAWGFDFVIGSLFFIVAIIFFYFFSVNFYFDSKEVFFEFNDQAVLVSDSLLSKGYPENWNSDNVVRIGLFNSEGVIDREKLENFYEIVNEDYTKSRELFGISNNYFVKFTPAININGNLIDVIGTQSAFYKDKIQVERIAVYNGTIYTLKIIVWD